MPEANCLSHEELSAFLAGQLNEAAIERVGDHLENCTLCRETVETLEKKEDTLFSQLRAPALAQPLSISAACERAMAAAEKLLDDSPPSAVTEAVLIPPGVLRIRDYQIVEKLGEGGMGTVYKAIHERLERTVAIKVLAADRLRDPQGVSRFEREMKAVGKLQHPNIVNAHDAGEADGTHFLAMEYVDGVDLAVLVTRLGPLPISDACELISQAALGLQHIHEHGLVHRDIKPSNLMLAMSGQVKILDLGLALLHDSQQPAGAELTGASQLMGTADYVSPEQA
jgi:serine/threonine protein kinase